VSDTKSHEATVHFSIAAALVAKYGLAEALAKRIVTDMVKRGIPHVRVDY
jgi:hypothetical protein